MFYKTSYLNTAMCKGEGLRRIEGREQLLLPQGNCSFAVTLTCSMRSGIQGMTVSSCQRNPPT